MVELDERRRRAAAVLGSAAKDAVFILKPKCANSAEIIDGKKEVEFVELACVKRIAGASRILTLLGMVTQNNAASPTVRFGIGDGVMKDRSAICAAMKLRAGHQRQRRVKRKPVGRG